MSEPVPDILQAFEHYRQRWHAIPDDQRQAILAEEEALRQR